MSKKKPLKEIYRIEKLDYRTATDIIIEKHYLHRPAPCSFAFGLICIETAAIIGVIMYGTPSSAPLRSGICGPEEKGNIIELTRLWIADTTPKNAESFLIGNTIPLVNKPIIVSFAEIAAGHIGTVYQATNWVYTGLSAKRTNWTIEGLNLHCQTIADKYTSKEIREKYGDRFKLVDRPRKHRYIYFNCNRRDKKRLIKKLRYPPQPYPKK